MLSSVRIIVQDQSAAGEARRQAATLAGQLGLDDVRRGNLAIVINELAKNLVIHAAGGEMLLQTGPDRSLQILSLDKGPGMRDLDKCMQDGFSTAGTAGIGLGAVQRLSDEFDIHSQPGQGTAIFCRFGGRPAVDGMRIGGINVPMRGETACGDAWACRQSPGRVTLLAADGLGHGLHAADAAREAVRIFQENPGIPPTDVLELAHDALRKTRGAAVAIAEWDLLEQTLRFAGIGNIAGTILTGDASRSLVSYNGIVGHEMRKAREFSYPCLLGAAVILNSDGLVSQWKLEPAAGWSVRHPALIAGLLYRDYSRGRDDTTVVVAR